MCLQCSDHCPKQEIELSKDELWTLYRAAYEQYKLEILNDGKLYDRYVNDFVSYHLPVFSSEEQIVRNHFKHVFSLYELLTTRKDLVTKYFAKSSFEKGDFETMVYEFNHIEVVVENPRILASFTPEQIRLITKFANESNFFVDGIDEETMDGFFKCALDESLVVVNMRQVLQLLYALSIEKMIPHNWVSLIADNQLLTPKSTGKASKRGAISSRLSELKASSAKFPSGEFLDFAKQLKRKISLLLTLLSVRSKVSCIRIYWGNFAPESIQFRG